MNMDISSYVALRYLKTNNENRFFSWISSLSTLGIAIGVASMIVVLSVINGFEDELRERFLAANAHILAYKFPGGLKNHEKTEELISSRFTDSVKGTAPFIHFDTMARKDYIIHAVLVKGFDPKKRKDVQNLAPTVRPSSALSLLDEEISLKKAGKPLPKIQSIILGKGLASIMQAKIGDTIEVISPKIENADNPLGQLVQYKLVGLYDSGLAHYDNKLGIISIPSAQELFNLDNRVTGIEIGLKDPNTSKTVANNILSITNLSVKEWQSYNRHIFEVMKSERAIIAIIVALVAFVASFNILTTLFVSVTQKQRDISILKSLGATNHQILLLFIKQSGLIGFIGCLLGVTLAFGLSKIIETVPFIKLPDIYLLTKLPVNYDWKVYVGVSISGLLIALLAGVYPALTASHTAPTSGLAVGRRAQ